MCKERNRRAVKPPANISIFCENSVCVCLSVSEYMKVHMRKMDKHKQSKSL